MEAAQKLQVGEFTIAFLSDGIWRNDGGNANQAAVLVDGAPVNTLYGNAVELVMDQDSIQEFNAQTHNNTAEFGRVKGLTLENWTLPVRRSRSTDGE